MTWVLAVCGAFAIQSFGWAAFGDEGRRLAALLTLALLAAICALVVAA